SLYKYYKETIFTKFSILEPHLFMEFRIGKSITDIKTFKWLCQDGLLAYQGNRFDHEYQFPPEHEFNWTRTHRELHRSGLHPHISIEDRVFVECVGGDLTIKVEDNTATGQGIYSENVDHRDQTLDDAEIFYASVGNLVLLKIRPYQEKAFRYFVFNEKLKEARRIDAIADSCVLLPDGHGIIFSHGYYLQSGEFKIFDTALEGMVFYKRIASPNGEDTLFTFYHRESGDYILLSYNLIARAVETPIVCSGFSLFENGEMALFRSDPQPQRHHVVQVWQTPYVGPAWQPEVQPTSYLYKIGNPALVGAMAECQGILTLLSKNDSYSGLYLDLVEESGAILDAYFWLDREDACNLREPLVEIRQAATAALAEFDKVENIKRSTAAEAQRVLEQASAILDLLPTQSFEQIGAFVARLAELRGMRGSLISLKELRYIDLPRVGETEQQVVVAAGQLAERTVAFLLKPEALDPLRDQVRALKDAVAALTKVAVAQALEEQMGVAARELDLLIETVSNLKIQDATETTRIIENVSAIYAVLNQARAGLKQKVRELRGNEAIAEFGAQSRLLDQALANFLDLCATPEKCDEYLNRLLVQVEELEARFSDFDEFVVELSEKRTLLASAFESRKIELIEVRNRKSHGLLTAAERILKAIKHRADHLESLDAINAYFASDLMVEKVRDQIAQLIALSDSVKADDLGSRLKTIREDAGRQLKDRQELFAGGANCIQLGRHQFLVNTQELDLTVVQRGGKMNLHLTGTSFFEPIIDPAFLATRPVWELEVVSESSEVYRAEYLAFRILENTKPDEAVSWSEETRLARVTKLMSPRYAEGYVKGVHDGDAAKILGTLLEMHASLGLLRYSSQARACAALFWQHFPEGERRSLLTAKLRGYATMKQLFPGAELQSSYIGELQTLLGEWTDRTAIFDASCLTQAAEYLYFQIKRGGNFVASPQAARLLHAFRQHLSVRGFEDAFQAIRASVEADLASLFVIVRDWLGAFIRNAGDDGALEFLDEAGWLLLRGTTSELDIIDASVAREVDGLLGSHPLLQGGRLVVHYIRFMEKLRIHTLTVVPAFECYQRLKKQHIEEARVRLQLENFKPKVLTSFVRNRLIDSAYLGLIGDNLAKQIGTAGDTKRTDRMGLLLLVSPPGYGKTTLMEYLASRLGIVFVKINGPAIGHRVTSLDPAEAPNASAREELAKLNLAFEMGDNVLVCLDDIQHLNPELLQKFISLCDGSRRIEGVYGGMPRTYDFRGKKVVVVMAGNPYTESGEKFQIPDMLANRADTYNLGDVAGSHAEAFRSSYLENAAASNPALGRVAGRSRKDLLTLIQLAELGPRDGLAFEGTYSPEELSEFVKVMRMMLRLRDVVLRVNEEYIRSAAQADAYRTEPAFKLQGSYRNMNRLAEKVAPVMNAGELEALIQEHYRNEAQTLTNGAEANLLKLRELTGTLTPEEAVRWETICKTFRKNQLFQGGDERDPVSQVVRQLSACFDGIDSIKEVLSAGFRDRLSPHVPSVTLIIAPPPCTPVAARDVPNGNENFSVGIREVQIDQETLVEIWKVIEERRKAGLSAQVCRSLDLSSGNSPP
ncbi:MAG: ATPase, partial [Chthoniobacteraceae bacterium]|nr:ATPase [Chthoniobacteraceae bacterium]